MVSLFAMMAAVGASISAIINALTARRNFNEVSENNRRALKPFLIIRNKEVNLTYKDEEVLHWLNWDTMTYDLEENSIKDVTYLELANISNGIAKNVVINIELKNQKNLIDSLATTKNPDPYMYLILSELEDEKIKVEYQIKVGSNGIEIYDKNVNEETKFIAVEKGNDYKVTLPPFFMVLFNFYFNKPDATSHENLPYLEIRIDYEDIAGNKYNQNYKFNVQTYNIQITGSKDGRETIVKAIYDIVEKKESDNPF
jgi:hypothetical protein